MWLKNAGCWAQETHFNIEKRNEVISKRHTTAAAPLLNHCRHSHCS